MMPRSILRIAASVLVIAGCGNAGEALVFPAFPNGSVSVGLYLDRDGTGTFSTLDTTFAGVRVALLSAGGVDTLETALSNANGIVTFSPVPVGSYRFVVDRAALGDSIGVVVGDTGVVRILARPDSANASRVVRLGWQEVTVAEARALPVGRRVMVRGIVLAPMQAFRDSSMFLRDGSGFLRITGTRHRPGRTGNNLGDSVTVVGTTGSALAQPVLLDGVVSSLGQGVAPTAEVISVTEARTARGGTLDAALVQVVGAKIVDTASVTPDFRVIFADAANNADRASALFDSLLLAPKSLFQFGLTITVRGVLQPRGDGTWMIRPRNGLDLTLTP